MSFQLKSESRGWEKTYAPFAERKGARREASGGCPGRGVPNVSINPANRIPNTSNNVRTWYWQLEPNEK